VKIADVIVFTGLVANVRRSAPRAVPIASLVGKRAVCAGGLG
jgi:hypothetical protein